MKIEKKQLHQFMLNNESLRSMTFQVGGVGNKSFSILIYVFGNVGIVTKNSLHICSFGKWFFSTDMLCLKMHVMLN